MATHRIPAGSTTPTITVTLRQDSTGGATAGNGLTGITAAGVTMYYSLAYVDGTTSGPTAVTVVTGTLGSYNTDTPASKASWVLLHDTNSPGDYQLCLPTNCVAVTTPAIREVKISIKVTGAIQAKELVMIEPVAADLQTIKTQTVTCAAGVTVNPNVGQTQPINFTGTAGSALVKTDVIDVAGQTASAAGTVTFPGTIASTTNITGGTITTVTTLTNLPAITTDWLSAAGVSAAAVTKLQAGLMMTADSSMTNLYAAAAAIQTVTDKINAMMEEDV